MLRFPFSDHEEWRLDIARRQRQRRRRRRRERMNETPHRMQTKVPEAERHIPFDISERAGSIPIAMGERTLCCALCCALYNSAKFLSFIVVSISLLLVLLLLLLIIITITCCEQWLEVAVQPVPPYRRRKLLLKFSVFSLIWFCRNFIAKPFGERKRKNRPISTIRNQTK